MHHGLKNSVPGFRGSTLELVLGTTKQLCLRTVFILCLPSPSGVLGEGPADNLSSKTGGFAAGSGPDQRSCFCYGPPSRAAGAAGLAASSFTVVFATLSPMQ